MVTDATAIGASLPTVAEGGSPKVDGINRDEYIALCRLARSHSAEYADLLVGSTRSEGMATEQLRDRMFDAVRAELAEPFASRVPAVAVALIVDICANVALAQDNCQHGWKRTNCSVCGLSEIPL